MVIIIMIIIHSPNTNNYHQMMTTMMMITTNTIRARTNRLHGGRAMAGLANEKRAAFLARAESLRMLHVLVLWEDGDTTDALVLCWNNSAPM